MPTGPSLSVDLAALAESLRNLIRGDALSLAGLLEDVEIHTIIDGSRVVCHCHSLKLDGNGRPRVRDLIVAMRDAVTDFAIPRSEIKAAIEDFDATHSTIKITRLGIKASKLFTDLTQSGEGGELLLFLLAERLLGLPQLLCKMSLKTNSRMHVHGADGVHAGVDLETNRLVLYWGESKIYADASAAIRKCLQSIAPMLRDDDNGEAPSDRDLQLLQRHADLADSRLEEVLKVFLDTGGTQYNQVEFRGLCLVGFNCSAYPSAPGNIDVDSI